MRTLVEKEYKSRAAVSKKIYNFSPRKSDLFKNEYLER